LRGIGRRYFAVMGMMSPSETRELSVAERIQLVQDLWDSIAAEPEALPVTDEQFGKVFGVLRRIANILMQHSHSTMS
jgi:putative addiction module component (TIGR02574 family)